MDTCLLLELSQLCQQILDQSTVGNETQYSNSKSKKRRKRDRKHVLKLYTLANLLLCGVGHNFQIGGCPSQMDAERLLLIIGDIIASNTNAIMESLYNDMIRGLKKCSLFSKRKLRKRFPYTLFVHAPQAADRKRGSLASFVNKVLLVDYVIIYPISFGWASAKKECSRKTHRVIKDAFSKRDTILSIMGNHKAQRSGNSSRFDAKLCMDGAGDICCEKQEPIAEVSREFSEKQHTDSDSSETSESDEIELKQGQNEVEHPEQETSGAETDFSLSDMNDKVLKIKLDVGHYSDTLDRLLERNRHHLCLSPASSDVSVDSVEKAPTPKTIHSSSSSSML